MMIRTICYLTVSLIFTVTVAYAEQPSEMFSNFINHCIRNSACNPDDPMMQGSDFYREFTGKYKIVFADNKIFSYYTDELSYSGGANGKRTVRVGSLLRGNGKKISLKDIVPDQPRQKKLLKLIISRTAKHFNCHINDLNKKLLNMPTLTENFYLNDKGLTFVYNEYEISGKAAGPITLFIPYSLYDIDSPFRSR